MAGPSATGNYAQAGKAAADEATRLFAITRQNSPDYSKIVQEAHIRQGKEYIAGLRAEKKVLQEGLNQYTATKNKKTVMDAEEKYGKAKRKAGILASAGSMLGTGIGGLGKKPYKKREVGGNEEYLDKRISSAKDAIAESNQALLDFRNNPQQPYSSVDTPSTNTSSGGGGGETNTSGKTVSADISAQHAAGPGKLSKAQIKNYAIQAGFTPEQASTVVGIAGGESGFDPTNSTKRSGLYAKTGEDSVGLMQINWGYHKDSGWLQGLGITKREQLLDPVTNMKAAKYLYDGRGNFGDWTVYNKGIYKDYL